MTCSCPKCQSQVEIDLSRIPESGLFHPCPECKDRFWITKESYARMALTKEGKTYCDKCGNELCHTIVCASCGIMYPDYYLAQASKPPRRQVEKPDLFSVSFSLKRAKKQTYAYTPAPQTPSASRASRASSPSSAAKPLKTRYTRVIQLATLVAILACGIGYYYHIKNAEQQFVKDYMRALYTIKSGSDLSFDTCAKISDEWKARIDAGQGSAPRIGADEVAKLNRAKEATDRFMKKLDKPPKKFIAAKEKIARLNDVYTRANALAAAPSGNLAGFMNSADKSRNEFNTAVNDLKGSLTPALTAEFQIAKTKYRGFKDI